MKKIALCFAIGAMAMTTLISSCSRNNGTTTVVCTSGALSATINSTAFTASSFQNTLLKATSGGIDAKRFDIRATSSTGQSFIISMSDWRDGKTGDGMRTGTYYLDATQNPCNTNGTACVGVILTYQGTTYTPINATGSVIITSCDATNHKMSGTFSGTVPDMINGGNLTVANGTFTDVCYTITQ